VHEYLSEFAKKYESISRRSSGAYKVLIHEKKPRPKISCYNPFNRSMGLVEYLGGWGRGDRQGRGNRGGKRDREPSRGKMAVDGTEGSRTPKAVERNEGLDGTDGHRGEKGCRGNRGQ
jgi:hypothetical protein